MYDGQGDQIMHLSTAQVKHKNAVSNLNLSQCILSATVKLFNVVILIFYVNAEYKVKFMCAIT
jgi:hypothetical protein